MLNIEINIIPFIRQELKNYSHWYERNEQTIKNKLTFYEQGGTVNDSIEMLMLQKCIINYLKSLTNFYGLFNSYLQEYNFFRNMIFLETRL